MDWSRLQVMDQKIAAAYDQAAAHLQELRDAYEQAGESARFQQQLSAFRERYSHRPAMIRRLIEL